MAPGKERTHCKFALTLMITAAILLSPAGFVQAREKLPTLASFIESVKDGQANMVRGVYVQDVLAYPIVQQPKNNPGYVSSDGGVLTQFNMAAEAGNVGLLAHNYLAGAVFSQLTSGQQVDVVYGDGRVESFKVTHIMRYQALDPLSPTSDFRDLETQKTVSAQELFRQVYRGDRHVTFQTCLAKDGNLSWGRLFILAEPVTVR